MGEMGEFWRDMRGVTKDLSSKKKEENYQSSKRLLEAAGVRFIEKDNGHFIILNGEGKPTHDFWATTGLIIERGTKRRSRGLRNLLRFVGVGDKVL